MKKFLWFCCMVFTVLCVTLGLPGHSAFAQELDEPVVTFSEPRVVSGDPVRCKVETISSMGNMVMLFPNAVISSDNLKRNALNCQMELDVTVQLTKGWYFNLIEHVADISLQTINQPQSKATLTINSKFKGRTVLQSRDTKFTVDENGSGIVSRSNNTPVTFIRSKEQQCSGKIQSVSGKNVLRFTA